MALKLQLLESSSAQAIRRAHLADLSHGTAESASIDCNEEPDLANLDDEVVVVSRSKVSTSYLI